MATAVTMPVLGLTMEEGLLNRWLKREGDRVQQGEPLLEVTGDKATSELEAPGSGVLRRILVPEGATVKVQTVLAYIAEPGEALPDLQEPAAEPAPAAQPEPARELKISPAARRVAREHGLTEAQLITIQGTGPGGRIVEDDLHAFMAKETVARAESAPATGAAGSGPRTAPVTGMRRTIADRMSRSQRTAAAVTLGMDVNMTEAVNLRSQLLREWEPRSLRISYTDMIVKAATIALQQHPLLNSSFGEAGIVVHPEIHIGVAVALEDGLVVPVIRNADKKSLAQMGEAARELAERARTGRLSIDEMSGSTFTVTNLGMYGVGFFTPIINPPEAAILGIGKLGTKLVLRDGQVAEQPELVLSLTFDHRIVDGAPAAEFLARLKAILEQPYLLFI